VAAAGGAPSAFGLNGTGIWEWRPAVVPGHGGMAGPVGGVAAASGRLYVVAPTGAARRINPESLTQRSPPGAFHLRVMDMATGRVASDQPLPAYYGGGTGVVVSVQSPSGVMAAGAGMVFVDPELYSNDVVEAFAS
jgi:hypothetical protein